MGAYSELDIDNDFENIPDDNDFPFCEEQELVGAVQQTSAAPTAATSVIPGFEDGDGQQADAAVSQQVKKDNTPPAAVQTNTEDADAAANEDAKRKAHEEAEAKRKAEWEAKQQAKKASEQKQLARLAAMSADELMSASVKRIGDDTEKLTRRNMKECVAEHIQTMCLEDMDFARKVMHPRKSMIHCIWYINRKAQEYAEQEMKNNAIKHDRSGIYGTDVPDDLCYQWAVDYFNDPNAKEDQEEEEKFVPKPYPGGSRSKGKSKPKKAEELPKVEIKQEVKKAESNQITLGGFDFPSEKAG